MKRFAVAAALLLACSKEPAESDEIVVKIAPATPEQAAAGSAATPKVPPPEVMAEALNHMQETVARAAEAEKRRGKRRRPSIEDTLRKQGFQILK